MKKTYNNLILEGTEKSYIVGVDAGTNVGLAIFKDGELLSLETLTGYKLICFLQNNKNLINKVIMEEAKKQGHIWNKNFNQTVASCMARKVGSVDGQTNIIKEVCETEGIEIVCISPKDKGRKWTAEQFSSHFSNWKGRTNEHTRDAAKCVYQFKYHLR